MQCRMRHWIFYAARETMPSQAKFGRATPGVANSMLGIVSCLPPQCDRKEQT
jgi:hypothetical protein